MPTRPLPHTGAKLLPLARALLVAVAALGAHAAFAATDYEDVDQLTQAGKLDDAMTRADAFLKEKPRDPQMRFLKGVIQLDSGKRSEAIATFTQLTQDSPELPEPYNNLAVLYAGQNQYDKARSVLETAIRTNPSYATAQENLGDVYARLASQAYSKALQLDQGNTAVQPKLAVIRTLFAPPAGAGGSSSARSSSSTVVAAANVPEAATRAPAAPRPPKAPAVPPPPPPAAPPPPAPVPAPAAPAPAPAKAPAAEVIAPAAVASAAPAATSAKAAPSSAIAEVETSVRRWASAWASQDMDRYLAAYTPDFTPGGGQSHKCG
jgi:tetratricopeptide (TPR) repeat protein